MSVARLCKRMFFTNAMVEDRQTTDNSDATIPRSPVHYLFTPRSVLTKNDCTGMLGLVFLVQLNNTDPPKPCTCINSVHPGYPIEIVPISSPQFSPKKIINDQIQIKNALKSTIESQEQQL